MVRPKSQTSLLRDVYVLHGLCTPGHATILNGETLGGGRVGEARVIDADLETERVQEEATPEERVAVRGI